jgi:hypothetical protein
MLQLWAGATTTRLGGPGLLGVRPGTPQPRHALPLPQQGLLTQGTPRQTVLGALYYDAPPPGFGASTLGFGAPPLRFGGLPLQQLYGIPPPLGTVWDQHALTNVEWNMDTGTDNLMSSNSCNLLSSQPPLSTSPSSIVVGNGPLLPVTSTSHTLVSALDCPLHLRHVLVSSDIIKNLTFIHQFTTDNQVSIEFDSYGLSMKDLRTKNVIVRCNSTW